MKRRTFIGGLLAACPALSTITKAFDPILATFAVD